MSYISSLLDANRSITQVLEASYIRGLKAHTLLQAQTIILVEAQQIMATMTDEQLRSATSPQTVG